MNKLRHLFLGLLITLAGFSVITVLSAASAIYGYAYNPTFGVITATSATLGGYAVPTVSSVNTWTGVNNFTVTPQAHTVALPQVASANTWTGVNNFTVTPQAHTVALPQVASANTWTGTNVFGAQVTSSQVIISAVTGLQTVVDNAPVALLDGVAVNNAWATVSDGVGSGKFVLLKFFISDSVGSSSLYLRTTGSAAAISSANQWGGAAVGTTEFGTARVVTNSSGQFDYYFSGTAGGALLYMYRAGYVF